MAQTLVFRENFRALDPEDWLFRAKGLAPLAEKHSQTETRYFKEGSPHFQFSPEQVTSNKVVASERYVVAALKLVDHVIPRESFAASHHGWLFANARTMWMAPLKQPHSCPPGKSFKTLGRLYLWTLEQEKSEDDD